MITNGFTYVAVLIFLAACLLGVQKLAKWKLFDYVPPVILLYLIAMVCALTPLGKVPGATELSNIMLYVIIALIASRTSLVEMGGMAVWVIAGLIIMFIHIVLMILSAKLFKLDLFTCSVASLSNIGGTASSTILAASYSGSLVTVGVLMSLMGNVIGTFVGIGVGYIMSLFAR